ncbi:hypothetical protein PYW08_005718 [Mythimna loreyi]|uniref:Uncharacterized protein n=1 Tax=Mythimna loreyi TaxID=667449 RepID=A0ACC2QJW8_9NEOP|nr:hypothetical protein PYW08_005718 [Mythimna loreyi]
MSALFGCGMCCFLMSIWAFLQLTIMGICYHFEAVTLIEDVEEEEYEDYDDFIKKTKHNYKVVARNCFIAAGIYFFLIFVSYGCIVKARAQMKKEEALLDDDEIFCAPKKPEPRNEKKIL